MAFGPRVCKAARRRAPGRTAPLRRRRRMRTLTPCPARPSTCSAPIGTTGSRRAAATSCRRSWSTAAPTRATRSSPTGRRGRCGCPRMRSPSPPTPARCSSWWNRSATTTAPPKPWRRDARHRVPHTFAELSIVSARNHSRIMVSNAPVPRIGGVHRCVAGRHRLLVPVPAGPEALDTLHAFWRRRFRTNASYPPAPRGGRRR